MDRLLVNLWMLIMIAPGLGLLPAVIARSKGRSFVKWWIYGTLLFVAAFPHSLLLDVIGPKKPCPYCRTPMGINAMHCGRCGYTFAEHL